MASSRLPGKVMEKLGGETVLSHVLRRCQAIETADMVCCATTEGSDGDPIAAEAARRGVEVFRGSEWDVLDRYYRAARHLSADVIMRVTSDCPLIDPAICASVLRLRAEGDADYACNNMPPSWPHGLDCEAFTFAWLERAAREASKPSEREHVTPFIRGHPEARKVNLEGPGGSIAKHRWTLDYLEDLVFLRALFHKLPADPAVPRMDDVLEVLDAYPEISAINRHCHDPGRQAEHSCTNKRKVP